MCGIFGCVGASQTLSILMNGLEDLEYRGYDSAGVAYFDKSRKIKIVKEVGKVENLKKRLNIKEEVYSGIAHTRWATHGTPTKTNCHPHKCGKITLVHNGIIENFNELKNQFNNDFYSDTDSEIIAKIINEKYNEKIKNKLENKINKKNLKNKKNNNELTEKIKIKLLISAINESCQIMRGAWAVALLCEDIPSEIFVFKKSSPLIVGKSPKFNLISSDLTAIYSNFEKLKINNNKINCYNLNDDEIAVINKNKVQFYNDKLEIISKEKIEINSITKSNGKAGFEHFMLKEIYEIPQSVKATVENILREDNKQIIELVRSCSKLTIIGCGTAYHAGLIGKFYFENLLNKKAEVQLASEFRYNKQIFDKNEIVLGITQSGETADTIAGLKLAKENGLKTIVLTNVRNSTITEIADFVLYTEAGKEIGVAATKSFNSQVAALCAFFHKVIDVDDEILNKLNCLTQLLESEIKWVDNPSNFNAFIDKNKFFFVGRDVDATISLEGALKLKEIAYVHAEGYAAGELKHGTLSLLDESSLLIAIITQSHILDKTLNSVYEARARGAKILLVSQFDLKNEADYFIPLQASDELLMPIISIIPLQLFAYYMSKSKGYDPDKPRNLAKSVTVE